MKSTKYANMKKIMLLTVIGPSETKPAQRCKNCSSKRATVHNFSTQYNTEQF